MISLQDLPILSRPDSIDAEERLLSCCLVDSAFIAYGIELGVETDHFSLPKHQTVWNLITEMQRTAIPIEPGNVIQALNDRGQMEAIGGPVGLSSLFAAEPVHSSFPIRVEKVREKWILRNALRFACELSEAAKGTGTPLEDVRRLLAANAAQIEGQLAGHSKALTIKEHCRAFVDRFEGRKEGRLSDSFPVGIPEFDNGPWRGMLRAGMTIISARPSSGKTALAIQIANGVCARGGHVAFFSLEMTAGQLMDRLVTVNGELKADAVMSERTVTEREKNKVTEAVIRVKDFALDIDDSPGQSADYITGKARAIHRRLPLDLIVVDYIQMVKGQRSKGDTQEREYAYVSDSMQALAKSTGAAVLILSQVNEDGATKGAKAFEEAADLWLHIIRERGEDQDEGVATVKCRHRGANGLILPLTLVKHLIRFKTRGNSQPLKP